ncbi:hypothetical protein G5B30_14020 [Sphingobacterium sp. SGG-5]|uniref:hypothetical protein n=1 Tax=Sphingobacterium sp. SGG-5 TaxID=2710881 RepID=UPI0013EACAD9|nr:hypothetical protein [Sphingobacterium sp. SGG-5]NGM63024.1 hypothetical protein [Sphingobacterium sp. SGG-5]
MKAHNPYAVKNSDFMQQIDVVCPRCEKKALVFGADLYAPAARHEEQVRFSCMACGYAIKYANTPKMIVYVNSRGMPKYSRVLYRNEPIDPFFGFTVWYRVDTKDGLLWAYNLEHLAVIETYIADPLRQRNGLPNQNNSLASRLPIWVGAAKNREYLLRLIARAKLKS